MLNVSRLMTTAALAAILLGSSSTIAPVFAQNAMAPATPSTTTQTTTASSPDVVQKMEAHVETRIKTLHDELKITPDQEAQWNTVAQTMRDNEATMTPLYEARKNGAAMSAIDNLKTHQAISQAYADAFGKFITAFEPLYNSMTDDQKKWADESFMKQDAHMKGQMKHSAKTTTTTGSGQ